jgi:hypothetical protein
VDGGWFGGGCAELFGLGEEAGEGGAGGEAVHEVSSLHNFEFLGEVQCKAKLRVWARRKRGVIFSGGPDRLKAGQHAVRGWGIRRIGRIRPIMGEMKGGAGGFDCGF